MPRISPDAVRRASLAFCPRTGVGGDNFHPRWFATLSDVSLARVCYLFSCFETLGLVPSTLWNILVTRGNTTGRHPGNLLIP